MGAAIIRGDIARMHVVFTADTHLGLDHPHRPRHPRRHRGPDFMRNFLAVVDHAIHTRADVLLHGGDVFDVCGVAGALVDQSYGAFLRAADCGVQVGIIAGNHERSVLPGALLMAHPNIHLFHGAGMHTFATRSGTLAVLGIPFVKGDVRNLLWETTARLRWPNSDVRLMLLHQPVEGAQVGPVGYVFRNRVDTIPASGIPPGVDVVLSGHIHRPQVLWVDTGLAAVPVIYPSSVERTSFAERAETKAFVELRFTGRERLFRHVALPARPMVDLPVCGATRARVLASLADVVAHAPSDAVVRITGPSEARALLDTRALDEVVPLGMSVAHHVAPVA